MFFSFSSETNTVTIRQDLSSEPDFLERQVPLLNDAVTGSFGTFVQTQNVRVLDLQLAQGVSYPVCVTRLGSIMYVLGLAHSVYYEVTNEPKDPETYCLPLDGPAWCSQSSSGIVYDGPNDMIGTGPV